MLNISFTVLFESRLMQFCGIWDVCLDDLLISLSLSWLIVCLNFCAFLFMHPLSYIYLLCFLSFLSVYLFSSAYPIQFQWVIKGTVKWKIKVLIVL